MCAAGPCLLEDSLIRGAASGSFLALNPAFFARSRRGPTIRPSTPRCSHCQSSCISRPASLSLQALSDDQVRDAYAIMGGIARPVLFLQSRGEKSVADMHDDVKAKIAKMGDTGWKVRRGVLLALLGLGMLWLLASVKVHMHGMIKLPAHLPAGQRRP